MRLEEKAGQLITLIEQNLQKLSDPFVSNIAAPYLKLSPMEIQVAQLVRDGKTNKEIAALLHLSKSTILTHRHHLRAKLGLKHQKKNLRSFLQTL
jgi:DNA-binding CsgD family transcriptional regulator